MKTITKISFGIATATLLFFTGCNESKGNDANMKSETVSEESLGLRKTDLYSETLVTPDKTEYSTEYAGSGKFIDRAFQDAPPMIPHDVEGMLPIQINNNQCTGCHMPEVAAAMGATAVPKSHLTNFRPKTALAKDGTITKNGKKIENTSSEKLEYVTLKSVDNLVGARFNCTLCHAPQSKGEIVKNTFEPEYTSPDGAKKSHWSGTKLTEGLDTLAK